MRRSIGLLLAYLACGPTLAQRSGYLDASACAPCHSAIYESYRRTGMGQSFHRPLSLHEGSYYHRASDESFRIYQRGGRWYQRRHQVGPDGREFNVVEMSIDFVLGSGNHALTCLHLTPGGQLIELPAGWYAESGGFWAMNPGYDRPDHMDFRRKIDKECFFCHNAYPNIEPGADPAGPDLFLKGDVPEGIDCQRCHGPGRNHVEAVRERRPIEAIRRAIVNPGRLSPDRQLEVCLQCHLESTSRNLPYSLRRYGREFFSYRPGEPLENYILHFDNAPGSGYDDKFEISHAAYRLMKSKCFRQSQGRLTCTTCHNPHAPAASEEAAGRYIQACKSCHSGAHNASQNCLVCHMPSRRAGDVVHVVMTDHYIQRRKPDRDLLAPLDEVHDTGRTAYRGEVALMYPPSLPPTAETELYLAVAQVTDGSNLTAGIPRLQKAIDRYRPAQAEFYFALAGAYGKVRQYEKAVSCYQEAFSRKPDYPAARLDCAAALRSLGRQAEATRMLASAVAASPRNSLLLNALGESYLQSARIDEAIQTLRRALSIDSGLPEIYVNLSAALSRKNSAGEVIDVLRDALRISPNLAAAHSNLATILAAQGDFVQAKYHFEKAIAARPDSATTHYNYGRALAQKSMWEEAEAELETALNLDSHFAEADTSLGILLARRGQTDAAIDHYRQALQAKPDLAEAHFNLGMELFRRGDFLAAEPHFEAVLRSNPNDGPAHLYLGRALASDGKYEAAMPHLQKAAGSPQPDVRAAAVDALSKINRQR